MFRVRHLPTTTTTHDDDARLRVDSGDGGGAGRGEDVGGFETRGRTGRTADFLDLVDAVRLTRRGAAFIPTPRATPPPPPPVLLLLHVTDTLAARRTLPPLLPRTAVNVAEAMIVEAILLRVSRNEVLCCCFRCAALCTLTRAGRGGEQETNLKMEKTGWLLGVDGQMEGVMMNSSKPMKKLVIDE